MHYFNTQITADIRWNLIIQRRIINLSRRNVKQIMSKNKIINPFHAIELRQIIIYINYKLYDCLLA